MHVPKQATESILKMLPKQITNMLPYRFNNVFEMTIQINYFRDREGLNTIFGQAKGN